MPVVGTAGHVDHGKSTLVRVLTGRDPDRWDEEKRRGLTIDLGFAWMRIGSAEVSFVDVPGHERFVKNMLAGIEAVDAAILVVAADEGWMPQTEEHAAVLDLLGIDRVIVTITKADRVDSTGSVRDDIRSRLAGLRFENAPMVDFAAPTRLGLDSLTSALEDLIAGIAETGPHVPHLWIDRAFTIPGAGTVVTGTLQGGRLDREDRMFVQPSGQVTRIRSIQSHERDVDHAIGRRRVALNLGGVAVSDVRRGTLLTKENRWTETDRLLVSLRPARYAELDERGAFHLHMGTGSWPARLQLSNGAAILRLDRPAPAVFGAPFVVRESGRRLVVSGGRVLDPRPSRRRDVVEPSIGPLLMASSPDEAAAAMLAARGHARAEELHVDTAGGSASAGVPIGARLYTEAAVADLVDRGSQELASFHRAYPLRSGMPVASLAEPLGLDATSIDDLTIHAGWSRSGALVSLANHESALTADQRAEQARIEAALRVDLRVPRVKELGIGRELLASLLATGSLVRISDDLVYLPDQLDEIRSRLAGFGEPFTVSDFRQRLDLSRKYAVPLLEWFDAQGVTQRRGDVRVVRE